MKEEEYKIFWNKFIPNTPKYDIITELCRLAQLKKYDYLIYGIENNLIRPYEKLDIYYNLLDNEMYNIIIDFYELNIFPKNSLFINNEISNFNILDALLRIFKYNNNEEYYLFFKNISKYLIYDDEVIHSRIMNIFEYGDYNDKLINLLIDININLFTVNRFRYWFNKLDKIRKLDIIRNNNFNILLENNILKLTDLKIPLFDVDYINEEILIKKRLKNKIYFSYIKNWKRKNLNLRNCLLTIK